MRPLPTIGFDRYVPRHWLDGALAVAAGEAGRDSIVAMLKREIEGIEARSKTMVILNRMWLTPHPTLVEFSRAGVEIYRGNKGVDTFALHWGMALASHPFLAAIVDNIGRLLKLHGEFTAMQVNRRLKEQLGDRASILRATEAVLQTLTEWQVIVEATDRKRCFLAGNRLARTTPPMSLWLLEAYLRTSGKSLHLNAPTNLAFPIEFLAIRESDLASHSRLTLTVTDSGNASVGIAR